jgi:hypothetical protein
MPQQIIILDGLNVSLRSKPVEGCISTRTARSSWLDFPRRMTGDRNFKTPKEINLLPNLKPEISEKEVKRSAERTAHLVK